MSDPAAFFRIWANTITISNDIMHSCIENAEWPSSGLGVDPGRVAQYDSEAAALLQSAQQAHDDLARHLEMRGEAAEKEAGR